MFPSWIVFVIGSMVILFGAFRLSLVFRSSTDEQVARERGGIFGYGRRTNLLFGLVYVLMGVLLLLGLVGVKMPWQH